MIEPTPENNLFDEKLAVKNFLDQLNFAELSNREKLIRITRVVSEIPWGEGRSIEDVFTKGVGTCTGKHKVLQACYDQIGIKYQPVVCTFKWSEQGLALPEELQSILEEGEWEHGHNFIQLENGNDVDITWNGKLSSVGFQTLQPDWDGSDSFVAINGIIKRWNNVEIDNMKAEIIGNLDEQMRNRRERFLRGFIEWINSINNS